ncbi:7 transmembrane sweet-taste receptor of 3 GCPR-domain-containing protein [Obelidium mucronatum]|nr:7 transmembrane sweet-taste receptor of 3 GCPR-domain-containing protein [Obelidium mucronatum]
MCQTLPLDYKCFNKETSCFYKQGMPNIKLNGGASALILDNPTTINNTIINFAAPLPPFEVHAQDVFGNTVPANLNAPVIVQIAETSQGATMSGDSTKAIVNDTSNAALFSGLKLANPMPGNYTFTIRGFPGSLVRPPGAQWQSFQITIAVCDPLTQRLFTGTSTCVPIVNTGSSIRFGMGIAAIIVIIFGALNLGGLLTYQSVKLIKANSLVFLSLTNVGCLLCLASLVVQISTAQNTCTVAAALDNFGFALIFGSILVKTSRIRIIFDEKLRRKIKVPTDAKLSLWVIALCLFMGGLLVAWFIVQSPEPVDMITASMAVTTRCNTATTFGVIVTIVRIVIIMFSAVLSFQIKDVPSTFNESKMLGFSAYNWFLFSALLNALVVFAISDPNTAFAIGGVAILVPTFTTVVLLISVKLHLCVTDPEAANRIETQKTSDMASSKAQGSTISAMSHATAPSKPNESTKNAASVKQADMKV